MLVHDLSMGKKKLYIADLKGCKQMYGILLTDNKSSRNYILWISSDFFFTKIKSSGKSEWLSKTICDQHFLINRINSSSICPFISSVVPSVVLSLVESKQVNSLKWTSMQKNGNGYRKYYLRYSSLCIEFSKTNIHWPRKF